MNTTAHDFVTVDMCGLKAALVEHARSQRVSVSALVRAAVARDLGLADPVEPQDTTASAASTSRAASVKLSIRMTPKEAEQLASGARAAGHSRGAYLAGLIAGVPVLSAGANRMDHISTLVASCAELATLSRSIHRLTALLRHGDVQVALEYRAMLDMVAGDVRRHLSVAARVLADLQPRSRGVGRSTQPTT